MKCPDCGEEAPSGSTTCPKCGRKLARKRQSARFFRFDPSAEPDAGEPDAGQPDGAAQDGPPPASPAPPAESPFEEADAAEEVSPLDALAQQMKTGSSPAAPPPAAAPVQAEPVQAEPVQAEPVVAPPPASVPAAPAPGGTEDDDALERLGPYRIKGVIGRGGMGAVYEGFDENLSRTVAIKVLPEEHAISEDFVRRFLAEAKAIAQLSHPNVVAVHYAGSEEGQYFFAMEYVEGENLQQVVEREGPLAAKTAVGYAHQAALGLEAACAEGIIHRDVKPANLMLTPDGVIKVADFGLAHGGDPGVTTTGEVAGSPYFMSPEQGRGEHVDHRADMYSLGATLYFLLTGSPPFAGEDAIAIIFKHVNEPPPKLPNAPYGLERLMKLLLAKAPSERPADYEHLVRDLHQLSERGVPPRPLVAAGDVAVEPGLSTPATVQISPEHEAERQKKAKIDRLLVELQSILEVPEGELGGGEG